MGLLLAFTKMAFRCQLPVQILLYLELESLYEIQPPLVKRKNREIKPWFKSMSHYTFYVSGEQERGWKTKADNAIGRSLQTITRSGEHHGSHTRGCGFRTEDTL